MIKKLLLVVLLIIVGTTTALAVFAYGTFSKITVHPRTPKTSPSPTPVVKVDEFHNGQPFSLLLLGYGGFYEGTAHEGGKLTDSMILAHVIPEKQKIFLISLPRDMWVSLPVNGTESAHWKINAAYAIGSDDRKYAHKPEQFTGPAGGGELAKYAVNEITGLPVDNFVALDFSGFVKTIDVLKGVDVDVDRTFDDNLYPIEGKEDDPCGHTPEDIAAISATMSATQVENAHLFACRYEQLHFDKGLTHMDGATALKYVRSRHSSQDGGDFERSARQRNLIVAVKHRILSLNFLPKIIPFVGSLGNDVQTDLEINDMEDALHYGSELSNYQIITLALTDKNVLVQTRSPDRQDVLMPRTGADDWASVKSWLSDQIAFQSTQSAELASPSPSPVVSPKLRVKTATASAVKRAQ